MEQALTAVRTYGASVKHLSDQSRSMLALFQESAIRVMDKEDGIEVPFSFFYDPSHKFIDHQHSQVISDAENNSKLDEFDVELLKVLFMIKYVETALQSAQYTIDNATSSSEKSKTTKAVTKYTKQLAEMKIYDEAIAHVANQRIGIDLDDGVKINYAKFQGVEVAQEGKKALKVDLLANIK